MPTPRHEQLLAARSQAANEWNRAKKLTDRDMSRKVQAYLEEADTRLDLGEPDLAYSADMSLPLRRATEDLREYLKLEEE